VVWVVSEVLVESAEWAVSVVWVVWVASGVLANPVASGELGESGALASLVA
jgi:hypothetical protein